MPNWYARKKNQFAPIKQSFLNYVISSKSHWQVKWFSVALPWCTVLKYTIYTLIICLSWLKFGGNYFHYVFDDLWVNENQMIFKCLVSFINIIKDINKISSSKCL